MKKKLQVFVSSTYTDLINERQAAVEAILKSGHIPAGMELFAAGNKSQMETIHRWIDESDIFMLILGARYGSLDPQSGKSYTQMEYEYAVNTAKPFFAVVLTDSAIDRKVQEEGKGVLESENPKLLKEFKSIVTSKICRMVDDAKDIKLAIHETLIDFTREYEFTGWVSGRELVGNEALSKQIAELGRENAQLRAKNEELQSTIKKQAESTKGPVQEYGGLLRVLDGEKVTFIQSGKQKEQSLLMWFVSARDHFVRGVENRVDASPFESFLFFQVAPKLAIHGLVQDEKVPGVRYRRYKTAKKGNDFLAYMVEVMTDVKEASPKPSASQVPPSTTPGTSQPAEKTPGTSQPAENTPSKPKSTRKPKS